VRAATAYTWKNAEALGGDPQRMYIMGHSSGGHLGGVVVTTDWEARGLPAAPFKGALLGSG
jgi:arylformamidase